MENPDRKYVVHRPHNDVLRVCAVTPTVTIEENFLMNKHGSFQTGLMRVYEDKVASVITACVAMFFLHPDSKTITIEI